MKYVLTLFALISVLAISCKDDDANPNPTENQSLCDSIDVTYEGHVKSLIDASCATGYCHASGAGGKYMTNYEETKASADYAGFLLAIKHQTGAAPMPKGSSKLSDADIQVLECWIQNGFKEK